MSMLAPISGLLALFVLPSLVFFLVGGPVSFDGHFWAFCVLAVFLFGPLMYFISGFGIGMHELGYTWVKIEPGVCINGGDGCTLVGRHGILMFFIGGPFIYWMDYFAGVHMHNVFFDED